MKNRYRLLINKIRSLSINTRFILLVTWIVVLILIVNVVLFININNMIDSIDDIYDSNVRLNELSTTLNLVSDNMTEYLNTKSTESMEYYYKYQSELLTLIDEYNEYPTGDKVRLSEKNIRSLITSYLKLTDGAIEAKRGRNIIKYKNYYDKSEVVRGYISDAIFNLNNERFKDNADKYRIMIHALHTIEIMCMIIFVLVSVMGIILVSIASNAITVPIKSLAVAARKVSEGDYDVELLSSGNHDEISVVTDAFNTMTDSIKDNIVTLRHNMEIEQQMKEKELLMEAHLKDAQLKYLQAQINPHFLFNTLNAGAQLAMMEGADRAYEYIQQVASFFRYNIKKDNDVVTLREEIVMVDTYVYILNVRFAGEIGYVKDIDETLLEVKVPSMCLQPIVENAVNYGIRNIDWAGIISLSVKKKDEIVRISVKDNGIGMSEERIEEVLERRVHTNDQLSDSNGIGLDNVMTRLELLYGAEDILDIYSEGTDKGTEVILNIPARDEDV